MIPFEYKLIRRRGHKNISISVYRDRRVIVTVDRNITNSQLREFIEEKTSWVKSRINSLPPEKKSPQFKDGQKFLFANQLYELKICNSNVNSIEYENSCLFVKVKNKLKENERSQMIKQLMIVFCKRMMKVLVAEKIQNYKNLIGKEPNNIRIKDCKTKWGSASSLGNLNFHWKILLLPENIQNYIILHEMTHLIHPNHSKEFYTFLEKVYPDRKDAELWLKKNGNDIDIEPMDEYRNQ
ncbi:MAG: M48 family metallopeptidase [Leptospiraceae bacterium]|nr:M48 family metallopeptidase [Leptospiraceae bacterium]MCK6380562.1 M48 family metallopeptidase [Leptospiraceae bacterium]NUM40733.1 M48 family metallopeptidase [Leptospiraceae bacterium]